jgi:hypothetical protein
MKLSEFYDEVARRADTDRTKITAADTRRVLSEAFKVLVKLDAATCSDELAKGLETAAKKGK